MPLRVASSASRAARRRVGARLRGLGRRGVAVRADPVLYASLRAARHAGGLLHAARGRALPPGGRQAKHRHGPGGGPGAGGRGRGGEGHARPDAGAGDAQHLHHGLHGAVGGTGSGADQRRSGRGHIALVGLSRVRALRADPGLQAALGGSGAGHHVRGVARGGCAVRPGHRPQQRAHSRAGGDGGGRRDSGTGRPGRRSCRASGRPRAPSNSTPAGT